jgi:glucose/mannose-6-phosphate isomerase
MLAMAEDFPAQCQRGLELGDALQLDESYRVPYNGIVGLGMGGSAIGSDLLAAIYRAELSAPAVTVREYELPAWVGERTLVFAVSYSGDTEETLAAFHEARRRGARVIGVTSGGELARLCQAQGVACVIVPGGQPPRASTGYLLMSLVAVIERLGLIGDQAAARRECLGILQAQAGEYAPSSLAAANRSKQLAEMMWGKVPIIYGSTPTFGVVANRWKTQCNENAKTLAHADAFPELNHNEIVGWELGRALVAKRCVIVLVDPALPPRMTLRLDVTQEVLGPDVEMQREVARGRFALARCLSAMYLGDFASLYLGLLNGVDPYEIKPINTLKQRLAQAQ